MLYGINDESLGKLTAATAGVTAHRIYYPPSQGVPKAWPLVQPGLTSVVSIRPDLEQTVAGKLDSQLLALLRTAPAFSWFTIWHEGNEPRFRFTAATFRQACERVLNVVTSNGLQVRFGQIFGTYPVQHDGQNLAPWVVPGCSFYGMDGYQASSSDTVGSVFGGTAAQIIRTTNQHHAVCITETNSHGDLDSWAEQTAMYARHRLQGPAYLLYASPDYGDYPNLPHPNVLQNIAREIANA